jgi:CDP-diacylglycerol--serine O-phosphatidyltransferase
MTQPVRRVRRVVIVLPSLFTLANLFFGIWSMVLAWHGEFYRAAWFIVIAGVLDMLDGVMARMGRAGTRFGAELDSLVDVVSFGVAPASLTYLWFFSHQGQYAWVFAYAFVVCVALRLARYNVHSASEHRSTFSGLPSPAAGMTLATYYPFTHTGFYQAELSGLPWSQIMVFLTIALSLAMVSNVRYARLPRMGVRSWRGLLGLGVNLIILAFAVWARDIFFFPLGLAYLTYGLVRAAVEGFLERAEDAAEGAGKAGLVIHDVDAGARVLRREPGAKDG